MKEEKLSKIKYMGHPFVDVGVAVMEIWLDKKCEDFTEDDLTKVKDLLVKQYDNPVIKGYLSTIFPNSFWANFNIKQETKELRQSELLEANKKINRKCVFCDREANYLANRAYFPLIAGESSFNYSNFGLTDLPLCKSCILSVQFLPLGSIKIEGRILIFWSTNNEWTYKLTKKLFDEFQQILLATKDKIEGYKRPKTQLIDILDKTLEEAKKNTILNDIVVYHFTNYGTSPDINLYNLPVKLTRFLMKIKNSDYAEVHNLIKNYYWNIPKKKGKEQETEIDYKNIQNKYWEALCDVFQSDNIKEESYKIVKRFYLIKDKDKVTLNCFGLAEIFLKEVSGMRKERLEVIKKFGDIIADIGQRDTKWINNLYLRELRPSEFLGYLTKLSKSLKDSNLTVKLDDVLILLDISNEEDSTINYQESSLIQALILIRVFERISQNKEILEQIKDKEGENE